LSRSEAQAFSALCMYSKFGHHPHPQATFVPNFVSFVASIAELAHGEKSHTHPASLFDALQNNPDCCTGVLAHFWWGTFCIGQNIFYKYSLPFSLENLPYCCVLQMLPRRKIL